MRKMENVEDLRRVSLSGLRTGSDKMVEHFDVKKVKELRTLAKGLCIPKYLTLRKRELVSAIVEKETFVGDETKEELVSELRGLKDEDEVGRFCEKYTLEMIRKAAEEMGVRSLTNKSRKRLVYESLVSEKKVKEVSCGHLKRKEGKCFACRKKCEHGNKRDVCVKCGDGKHICEHGKVKYVCIRCDGTQICRHKRQKLRCRDCKPKKRVRFLEGTLEYIDLVKTDDEEEEEK